MPDPGSRALLVDFGGVLTSSIFDSFRAYAGGLGPDPHLVERLFREDEESQRLLVEHETGRLPLSEFERGFALRMGEHGAEFEGDGTGLVAQLTAGLAPDEAMIGAVRRIREAGFPTVIVSNSLGYDAYEGYDLESLVDHVILSGDVGARKPSRRIYAMAVERAGLDAGACVMVDDLEQNVSGAERLGITGVLHREAAETLPRLEGLFGVELSDLPAGEAA